MSGTKKRRGLKIFIVILLLIIVGLPLVSVASSFIGRIAPESVIPDSYDFYARVPNPVRFIGRLANHESMPEILGLAELVPVMTMLEQFNNSRLSENQWIRLVTKGRLDAAFFSDGRILGAWDAGVTAPILKFLPTLMGNITVPGLYYVQAGKNSRFEYRMDDGTVFYISPHKNLLVISNNSSLFESVLGGTSRDGDRIGADNKGFYSRDYDVAFLLSPQVLLNALGGSGTDPQVLSAVNLLQFSGPVEASLTVLPNQLKLNIITPLGTGNQALQRILQKNSQATPLQAMIPSSSQYLTMLSAGNLQELMDVVTAISAGPGGGSEWENTLRRADSTSKFTLGMDLQDLLYSWTGTQFAIFGLEGRPNPVIAIEIKDEAKRKEVFDKAFRSIFVNENIRLNLDGNRIPRIEIPGFLSALLELMGVNVPSPYYAVQNNYLFISESAEALLATVNAVRRNDVLPRTDLWRTLSENNSGPSSFNLFYSLDRSLPFFLKGNSAVTSILKLYRQGLVRVELRDRVLRVSLSIIPGAGKGIVPLPGYPLDLPPSAQGTAQGRTGNRLYRISSNRDTRLVLTRGGDVLSVNPLDRSIKELKGAATPGTILYAIPYTAETSPASPVTAGEGAIWVVDSQGHVNLVDKDLESLMGFPVSSGIRLSAAPGTWGGRLFLSAEDGSVYTVNNRGSVSRWRTAFSSALRSPLSFLDFKMKTYSASYPKSLFFGEIFVLDADGNALPNWPVPVSGIAFGSPLLFSASYPDREEKIFAAFVTQAGELSVYGENAQTLPEFPIELNGVFYLQPVFDGENLWLIESEGTLYRVSLDGEIFSQSIPRFSVKEDGYITVANTVGEKEIFFSGEGNALHGYALNFNSLDGFPLPIWGKPVFGDINGDGKTEAAGIGMDNRLYVWQFR